jgi:arabinogalactan oligomer / maltooligosaccharide transport system substrate-binding protein
MGLASAVTRRWPGRGGGGGASHARAEDHPRLGGGIDVVRGRLLRRRQGSLRGAAEGGVALTIWADDKYSRAIKGSATQWGEQNDLRVNVQTVSKDLQTVFVTASQAGKGPDLVMGAHDWIGNLVQNGAIDPLQLTDDTRTAFNELAIKGVTYNG